MTPIKMEEELQCIKKMICKVAEFNGLSSDTLKPIYDGINGIDAYNAYLKSNLKIAWILKEPYDEWNEDGSPKGGDWTVGDAFIDHENNPGKKIPKTWINIADVMYGFKNNLTFVELAEIKDLREIIAELRSITYINLSKMPNKSISSDEQYSAAYRNYWKEVVAEQLQLFAPEVIIFGFTYKTMKDSFPNAKQDEDLSAKLGIVKYLRNTPNQILLDTYHPSNTYISGYGRHGLIDTLISALKIAYSELKGR